MPSVLSPLPLDPIRKIRATAAAEICGRVELAKEARAFLTPSLSPQGFLSLLERNELFTDAVRFLAFALPAREGVWWACMVGSAVPGAMSADPDRAYSAAQEWVYAPSDAQRFACLAAAEEVQSKTAGAYAALGAFWSGGSMTDSNLPEVLPDLALSPTGVAASILLAVAAGDPLEAGSYFRDAIRRGVDIGNGLDGRGGPSRMDKGARS